MSDVDVPLRRLRAPLLTIVAPVSRGPDVVGPLVESLERQTVDPVRFELVLVTDDDARYASDVITVRCLRSPHRHPCVKRNAGAAAARATAYLAFVDDDVKLHEGWVEAALAALAEADVVTGPSNDPYDGAFEQEVANRVVCSRIFSLKRTLANPERAPAPPSEVSLCNVAMRRAVFDRVGGFNEVAPYWVDDAEFFYLAAREGFRLVNDPRLRAAHLKRPIVWPLARHYFRQRWHAGRSTWCFPELYLPQRGVQAAALLLLLALALAATRSPAAYAAGAALGLLAFTGVALYGAVALTPPAPPWRRALGGLAAALAVAATVLGFWAGLLTGPQALLAGRAALSHKRWRYRDRDKPFEGVELEQGRLAALRQTVPFRIFPRRDFPQWLIFFVTARCNARCSMCFYWEEIEGADRARELSLDEIRRVAASLPKITYLSLSGGEPYLREDLADVVQAIVDAADPVFVSIPTNGAFPDRVASAVDALSRRNPGTSFDVHLSLDGPPAVHDRIRGTRAASYASVMATYRAVIGLARRRRNVGVKFVVTVSAENVDALDGFLDELAATTDADRIHLVPLHGNYKDRDLAAPHGRFLELTEKAWRLTSERRARGFRHRLFAAIKRASDARLERLRREADLGAVCGAGQKIVVLGPYGDVLPCEPLQEPVGNVRDHGYSLPAVLAGDGMRAFAERRLGPGKCDCNWGCAIGNAQVHDWTFYPEVARELLRGLRTRAR